MPPTLRAYDRDRARDRTWDDPRCQYDRASVDRVVLQPHALGLDCPDRGRDPDVHSAPLEQARCCRRQLLVNLWQNPRPGLEQPKAHLVSTDARIEAQHAVCKGREFTDEFYADESAPDHDHRQTLAPLSGIRGGVSAFEALDQVISQH